MKIMYVASNPIEAKQVMAEYELSDLQDRFSGAVGEAVEFVALPRLPFERFAIELARHLPDVLHISSHGDKEALALSNADGQAVPLDADGLKALLRVERPPKLVYLNACNSQEIAERLTAVVSYAIGTSAPITNRTARAAAVVFYDWLLRSASIADAFEASRETLRAMEASHPATSVLCCRPGVQPSVDRLYQVPQIVARFVDNQLKANRQGLWWIRSGVFGCPQDVQQVVMFTDDMDFIEDDEEDDDDEEERGEFELAQYLCRVIRRSPVRNIIWSEEEQGIYGDFKVFAAGTTSDGRVFSVGSTLIEALHAYYSRVEPEVFRAQNFARSIRELRSADGAGLPEPFCTQRLGGTPSRTTKAKRKEPAIKGGTKKGKRLKKLRK